MQPGDDRFQDLLDAASFLRAGEDGGGAVEPDDLLELTPRLLRLGAGQIDLVDDRNDLEVVFDGEIRVGECLCLHALRRVDEEQCALARRQRSRDLVAEVHVARRVDQVEDVLLAVVCPVVEPDRVRLDRDAALALEVHAVEHLRRHLAELECPGDLEKAVSQRRLAVIDVRDDREIPDVAGGHGRDENSQFSVVSCQFKTNIAVATSRVPRFELTTGNWKLTGLTYYALSCRLAPCS